MQWSSDPTTNHTILRFGGGDTFQTIIPSLKYKNTEKTTRVRRWLELLPEERNTDVTARRSRCSEERAPIGSRLQLVSRLPHHEAVQALQVPPAVVLLALLPGPEHNQGGVTSHLGTNPGQNINKQQSKQAEESVPVGLND